jgi:hypothetical protein
MDPCYLKIQCYIAATYFCIIYVILKEPYIKS